MNALGKRHISAMVLAAAVLSPALAISAAQPPRPPSADQNQVSDAELRAFARAYVGYHKIRRKYEPELKAAKTPQEKKRIEDEANAEIKDVLARQRLTVQNYNRVFTLVNKDETLRNKAMKLIEQERKKG